MPVEIAECICQRCGNAYKPTARGQKYCGRQKIKGTCAWFVGREQTANYIKQNPVKMAAYRERWWLKLQADPDRLAKYESRVRRKDLRRHGLTVEQYDSMKAAQNGGCAICGSTAGRTLLGRSKDLAVDHCHTTGKIRGLLCDDCNIGLGCFRDDPTRLINAAKYLGASQ